MSRRALGAVVLLTLALGAAPARAAQTTQFLVSGRNVISVTQLQFTETGSLGVTFAGSPSAGCAAIGVCQYSGRIQSFATSGELAVYKVRARHGTKLVALGGSFPLDQSGPGTTAEVNRALAGGGVARCADAVLPGRGIDVSLGAGPTLDLQLLGPDTQLVATRCAGPTDAELAAISPKLSIPVSEARHGHTTLDLHGSSSFTAAGFAGQLTSTIALHLGTPHTISLPEKPRWPPHTKFTRARVASESLDLEAIHGQLQLGISGAPDPAVCSLFDSCGLQGQAVFAPQAQSGAGQMTTEGSARLPPRRFLAGLGLTTASRPLPMAGLVNWSDPSPAPITVQQAGSTCHASTPLVGGSLELAATGSRVRVTLLAGGSLRSECPGPFLTSLGQETELATSTIARSAIGPRTFSVKLHPVGPISDEGYTIQVSGGLSVQLRHGRLIQTFERLPR